MAVRVLIALVALLLGLWLVPAARALRAGSTATRRGR
jgi:hypothetical protein